MFRLWKRTDGRSQRQPLPAAHGAPVLAQLAIGEDTGERHAQARARMHQLLESGQGRARALIAGQGEQTFRVGVSDAGLLF